MINLNIENSNIYIKGNIKNRDDLDLIVNSVNKMKNAYKLNIYLINSMSITSEVFMFLEKHQKEFRNLFIYVKDKNLLRFADEDLNTSRVLRFNKFLEVLKW